MVIKSLQEALMEDPAVDEATQEAVNTFIQLIFGYSYATFKVQLDLLFIIQVLGLKF